MPEPASPTVTAVIVAFNSEHALPLCLMALSEAGVCSIVVDNDSSDNSARLAEACGAKVIRSEVNLGYGRAVNLGVAAADSELVLICNPDAVVMPDAMMALLAAVRRWPRAGLYGPRLIEPDGRDNTLTRSFLAPDSQPIDPDDDARVPMLSGACLLLRRELFMDMDGFDPNIFLFYEDDDLCRRMQDRGLDLIRVHAARVRHGRGRSSRPAPGLVRLSRYHQAWSKAYVAHKYGLPSPAFSLLAVNGPKYLLACLGGQRARQERYGGTVTGAWDALFARRQSVAPKPALATQHVRS